MGCPPSVPPITPNPPESVFSSTYPNGLELVSSSQSPQQLETIFQNLVAQMLGINPTSDPQDAWTAVRVGWQTYGQPAWAIRDDVCIVRVTPNDHPYTHTREGFYGNGTDTTVESEMGYTQVWDLLLTFYGPNSYEHARQVRSTFAFDWSHDYLLPYNLYMVTQWNSPQRVPELYQRQWWERVDLQLQFNELVTENLVVPSTASLEITVLKDNGLSDTVTITP